VGKIGLATLERKHRGVSVWLTNYKVLCTNENCFTKLKQEKTFLYFWGNNDTGFSIKAVG
jgi:hypothetical protein